MHTTNKTLTRALGAIAITLALGAGLTACGDDTNDAAGNANSADASTTQPNDADVTFATDMIVHHSQALAMVDLTKGRRLDPQVQALAEDIRAAQAPEIETMTGWLTAWGEEVPDTTGGGGHDMGNMNGEDDMSGDMPSMMTAEDMDALESAPDAEFQDMWLQMMIKHHQGAVEMAQTEQENGQFQDAIDLAGQIIDAQNKEIDTMNGLLDS